MGVARQSNLDQLDLFLFARGANRVALDDTSWVEHISGWLPYAAKLFAELAEKAGWEQRDRFMYDKTVSEPRLTAEYRILAEAEVAGVREIGARLSGQYGIPYDRAWLNLYRDHRDSTAWHSDKQCLSAECIVPVLSLGQTRRFLIRPRAGGKSLTFLAKSGDLITMGGRCQRDWVHCVPKEALPATARISINFSSASQAIPPA